MNTESKELTVRVVPVLTYSRVCGYFADTAHFNPGKKEEFRERQERLDKLPRGII